MQGIYKGSPTNKRKFYLSNIDGISNIKQVDEHEMILNLPMKIGISLSIQDLLIEDNYRYRVIYSWNKDKLKIVENHHEIKIIT